MTFVAARKSVHTINRLVFIQPLKLPNRAAGLRVFSTLDLAACLTAGSAWAADQTGKIDKLTFKLEPEPKTASTR